MRSQLIFIISLIFTIKNVKGQNFDQLRQTVTVTEQRAYIKLSVLLERSQKEVMADLKNIVPDSHLGQTQVHTWYKDFYDGRRTSIEDLPKSGRPRETTDEANKEWVNELIIESEG